MYSQTSKLTVVVAILLLIFIVGGGLFLYLKSKEKLVSPVPSQPNFQVIFYTPTPGETTPTSTPSATPKAKQPTKAPTETPKPEEPSPTLEEKEEPTATPISEPNP